MALGLGVSTLGAAGSFVTPYRSYFVAFTVVSLAWTFYGAYRPKLRAAQGKGGRQILTALRPTRREAPVYVIAAVVLALVLFPYWGAPLYLN